MWWGPIGDRGQDDWRRPGTILDQMLISLSTTAPGRVRAVAFLKSKYSTIAALNAAWYGPKAELCLTFAAAHSHTSRRLQGHDLRELRCHHHHSGGLDRAHHRLQQLWLPGCRPVLQRHPHRCAPLLLLQLRHFISPAMVGGPTAIRTFDPYHMLLGVRFVGAPTEGVLRAAGEYNDVVSINSYPSTSEPSGPPTSRITTIYNAAKKPILIGEFAYKATVRVHLYLSGRPNYTVYSLTRHCTFHITGLWTAQHQGCWPSRGHPGPARGGLQELHHQAGPVAGPGRLPLVPVV